MHDWIDHRRAGVLLHIFSLPGPQPHGVLGEEAKAFIHAIREGGFSVWQFLPLGPTHGHGSPYESLSSFAGNADFLDLRDFVVGGWLTEARYQAVVDGNLTPEAARAEAAQAFWKQAQHDAELQRSIDEFEAAHAGWLADYALFTALRAAHDEQPWWEWDEPLRRREPAALKSARQKHAVRIHQTRFEQWAFDRQWQALKAYAEVHDVLLFGDLPIYVAHDSADVWAQQHYFTVNDSGRCDEVAGVPPDYFSETGQRWGNPLYRWETLQNDGFDWWIRRIEVQLERMHLLRIDHFRGLEAYWAIPGEREDGMVGEWRSAPGVALLQALDDRLGKLPLVAEDLGLITEEVHAMRERFGLPGMKILQFAFGGEADNPYLPHNHEADSVVYTGTHDNDTALGWFHDTPEETRKHLCHYLGSALDDMPWPLIRTALASVARLAVVPMQDVLSLGGDARLNQPGTLEGNWEWRLDADQLTPDIWKQTRQLNDLYDRSNL